MALTCFFFFGAIRGYWLGGQCSTWERSDTRWNFSRAIGELPYSRRKTPKGEVLIGCDMGPFYFFCFS